MVSTETILYLAKGGEPTCDAGSVSVNQAECAAAVRRFAEKAGKTPGRGMQVMNCNECECSSGWGQVPLGCSAQSGGDWAAHYKTGDDNLEICLNSAYQLVCKYTGKLFWDFVK